MIIKQTELKEVTGEYNVSHEYKEALDELVKKNLIERSMQRAKENNRKTLYERDL